LTLVQGTARRDIACLPTSQKTKRQKENKMAGNGHKMSKEEELLELQKELIERKERCQAKLDEFAVYLRNLHDCQIDAIRDNAGEMAAYYMSKSPNSSLLLLCPDLLLDVVSLMIFSFWEGMNLDKLNRKEDERRGKA